MPAHPQGPLEKHTLGHRHPPTSSNSLAESIDAHTLWQLQQKEETAVSVPFRSEPPEDFL